MSGYSPNRSRHRAMTPAQRLEIVARVQAGETKNALGRELQINPDVIRQWERAAQGAIPRGCKNRACRRPNCATSAEHYGHRFGYRLECERCGVGHGEWRETLAVCEGVTQ